MGVRIKSGDTVKVIAGRESGKTGEVERVIPKAVSYTHLTLPTNREV